MQRIGEGRRSHDLLLNETIGFGRQRVQISKLAHSLSADPRRFPKTYGEEKMLNNTFQLRME